MANKTAMSEQEQKWYDRLVKRMAEQKTNYYNSWWLRLDYELEEKGVTTAKINYWLTKLVKKGLLTKSKSSNCTRYMQVENYETTYQNTSNQ